LKGLLGRKPSESIAPGATILQPLSTTSPSREDQSTPISQSPRENLALQLALAKRLECLPEVEKAAFEDACRDLTDQKLLERVKVCDAEHKKKSYFRPQAEALSRFLSLLDRFMAGITIGIQSHPEISAIVVGGVRLVLSIALNFAVFFTKLSDMFCRLGDFLAPLAEYAKASHREELVLQALANVYGDLLKFCQHAHSVFAEQASLRRRASWRIFWRIQWIPFEEEFGRIESDVQHHLNVLNLSVQALGLGASLDASRADRERREAQQRWSFFR
jgi:ankyrin repeat domain-containing protein 50